MPNPQLRSQVISLYKQLVYLGREYPAGYSKLETMYYLKKYRTLRKRYNDSE
ncbi:uncharacterized protein B0P05DRAFT_542138 [Gilbertella persicaria]|uniref:uncharacterized protein n=1 Tax=Gilbertella persicaria TaxID=101096 RepID=UPI00221FFC92|nr:uncharacterized protein B0P05DRAFT_542138 [Gilbertella persicaria]KAI8079038.1 hypothetical protein B0P05DRAFT_542138 [Gilbertella persicaria]